MFLNNFVEYYNNVSFGGYSDPLIETDAARKARREINLVQTDVKKAIVEAGCYALVKYQDAPIAGGRVFNIDPIENMFQLHRFDIQPQFVTDSVERALGVYERDRGNALIRTLNPFWWFWKVVKWVAALPFTLIEAAGFNRSQLEQTLVGKMIKLLAECLILSLTVLQLDQLVLSGKLLAYIKALVTI